MQQAARHLAGALEDERIRPRGHALDRTERVVVEQDELPELSEVAAYEGVVVFVVKAAQISDAIFRLLVAEGGAECVAGVRRVGDQTPGAQRLDRLPDRARLRVVRVDVEVARHTITLARREDRSMRCDYYRAGVCRSCTHLEVPYPEQVVAKDRRVRDLLSAVVPADAWRVPFVGPESGFRNKAKLVAGGTTGAVTLGILDPPGRGVDLRECGLHEAAIVAALLPLAGFIEDIGLIPYAVPERRGELKHVLVTAAPGGVLMIRFVLRSTAQLALIRNRLGLLLDSVPGADVVSVNIQPEHKAILEGEREIILSPNDSLRMPLGPVPLYLQPGGFFQTNTVVGAGALRPGDVLDRRRRAWDGMGHLLRGRWIRVARGIRGSVGCRN
jgi:hypothetical protein